MFHKSDDQLEPNSNIHYAWKQTNKSAKRKIFIDLVEKLLSISDVQFYSLYEC